MRTVSRFLLLTACSMVLLFVSSAPSGAQTATQPAPSRTPDVIYVPTPHEVVDAMLKVANVEAITAMALMTVTVALAVWLIGSMIVSRDAARLIAVGVWLFAVLLWWGVPLRRRLADG